MVTYLIDAYNVLHKIKSVEQSANPQYELVQYIKQNRLTGNIKNRVILFFDGYESPDFPNERGFLIQFSCDRSADDDIKEQIRKAKDKKQLIVVSDDLEIRETARVEGARLVRVHEFLSQPKKQGKKSTEEDDDRPINCSDMIEITEEMEKIWIDKKR